MKLIEHIITGIVVTGLMAVYMSLWIYIIFRIVDIWVIFSIDQFDLLSTGNSILMIIVWILGMIFWILDYKNWTYGNG